MPILLPPTVVDGMLYNGKVAFGDGANELYRDIMLDRHQFGVIDPGLFYQRLVGVHCTRHRSVAQFLLARFHLGAAIMTVNDTMDAWLDAWLGAGTTFVCQDWPAVLCQHTEHTERDKERDNVYSHASTMMCAISCDDNKPADPNVEVIFMNPSVFGR